MMVVAVAILAAVKDGGLRHGGCRERARGTLGLARLGAAYKGREWELHLFRALCGAAMDTSRVQPIKLARVGRGQRSGAGLGLV